MPPKKGGPAGAAEVFIYDDCFTRAMKIKEANLKPGKPKGDLTEEDMSLPPTVKSMPDFRAPVAYFNNASTVKFNERDNFKWPTDAKVVATLGKSASDTELVRKNKKEVQDVLKFMKGQVKLAEKTKKAFFKQVQKVEKKNDKRKDMMKKISDTETEIDGYLRTAADFSRDNRLFALQYLYGSKLGGDKAPPPSERVAIVIEKSDKMAPYVDNAKDDVMKFFTAVEKNGQEATFNTFFFSSAGITPYKPTYLPCVAPPGTKGPAARAGSMDCIKFLTKQCNPKAFQATPWPPDWLALIEALCPAAEEGKPPPEYPAHLYVVCSKVPIPSQSTLDRVAEIRASGVALPVTLISYDPEVKGDFTQESWFKNFVGPDGHWELDTSKEQMEFIDKKLADVKKKKKQLDKFQKKLDKMEDLTEQLENFRGLLHQQDALESLARNDFALVDLATKTPAA
jgi:hypothetical protein